MRYLRLMVVTDPSRARYVAAGLLCGLAAFAVPLPAAAHTQAQLVHCGAETCLRLSGHRPQATTAVRIGASALAVDGGRGWQATVPLRTARSWPIARGYALNVVFADADTGAERAERVPLPPGALGSRIELVSLEVSAR